jgi:hypothetical protein
MRRLRLVIARFALMVLVLASTGCSIEQYTEEKQAQSQDIIAPKVAAEWEKATGEKVDSQKMHLTTGKLSESHSVMASMILMGNGMESDLSQYKEEVSIVDFVDASGTERAAVIVGSKVVLPKAAGAAPASPSGELNP